MSNDLGGGSWWSNFFETGSGEHEKTSDRSFPTASFRGGVASLREGGEESDNRSTRNIQTSNGRDRTLRGQTCVKIGNLLLRV